MRRPPALLLVLLALAAGCDNQLILRTFPLGPEAVLPSGSSAFLGPSLKVNATGLEPLASAARYVAWVEEGEKKTALGELKLGQTLTVEGGPVATPSAITGVMVTEELTESSLPQTPGRMRLRGPPGGLLELPTLKPAALAAAGGEVQLQDEMLDVMTSGLPKPGEGLEYAVWARFTPDEDCEAVEGGHVLMGTLDENGALMAMPRYLLASMDELVVTVESLRGQPDAMSPLRVLDGHLTLPKPGAASAESAPHSH